MSIAQLSLGLELASAPGVLTESMLRHTVNLFHSEVPFIGALLLIGCFRICVLFANGYFRFWGAIGRSVGAFLGGIVWFEITLSLFLLSTSPQPVLIPVFAVLAIWEFDSCYRAARDARRN